VTRAAIQHSTKPKARAITALERVQELFFSNQYSYALRLLERIYRMPELEHWRGILQIGLGLFAEAQHSLATALALGYRGSVGPQAVLHRLTGQSRAWLLQFGEADFDNLNAFDRVTLHREIGHYHKENSDHIAAQYWFERAWNTALTGAHGRHQLPGVGESLGHVLGELGQHAQAVHVLDEALKYANAQRRVPLLLERVTWNLYLRRLQAVNSDLNDIKTFVPSLPTDWTLPARLKYLEGRYHHALGDLTTALQCFKDTEGLAIHAKHPETEFYAILWIYTTLLELNRFETFELNPPRYANGYIEVYEFGADFYGDRVVEFSSSERHVAWGHLRHALQELKHHQNHGNALGLADAALKLFKGLNATWEIGAVWLTQAEIAQAQGSDFDTKIALREALSVARALGGTVVYQTELRGLPLLTAYLERPDLSSEFLEFITSSTAYQRLTVYLHEIELNDEPAFVAKETVRLLRYLVEHPRSTWAHIKNAVYGVHPEDEAKSEFRVAARVLGLIGVNIILDGSSQLYSATWPGLSLELMDEPMNLIGPAAQIN
jgi:tetratricopeptide (TPR) repeat protein